MPSVLIVDDHPAFRMSARALLEAEGFTVAEAGSAGAGVRIAAELGPDVVLLDVQLPDFDGFQAAAQLARITPAPTVILVSSRDLADYGPLVQNSYAHGFIPKQELSGAAIRSFLGTIHS
jgi:CheY-like chemotaxis protein